MIVYKDGEVSVIRNCRVRLEDIIVDTVNDNDLKKMYKVFLDGEFFVDAVVMFLEHKQYLLFEKNYMHIDFVKEFNSVPSIIFCDIGTVTKTKDIANISSGMVFRDYTEKGREGISYFSNVLQDFISNNDFKDKYVKIGDVV